MPNHITNEIRVIGGTNKQRLDFIRAITNKKGLIDFNTICRRPKSIEMEEKQSYQAHGLCNGGRNSLRPHVR